ncbi:hypothetical protein EFY79_14175 [Hanamia caeni]|jgi:hypothetical protein|uniref:Uncharacterized protein n=1 Tax=Hanamia caeni TaxID=2294116 RepID=A0A3M9NAL0_9BACT|nr:hypothetical protein EFY79_14175 [Hanamia caeni]
MVARINTSKSHLKALNYNEQKVRNEKAACICASGFIKGKNELNFYNKLHHFERYISLSNQGNGYIFFIALLINRSSIASVIICLVSFFILLTSSRQFFINIKRITEPFHCL